MSESTDFFDDESKQMQKSRKTNSKTPILDNFSRDLTKLASNGEIDPIIGRDEEVKRISQILSRKKKNNAIIVGEAGVGKTALIEKLALLINSGKCSSNLLDKRIVALDLSSMVAGTKYRGQFEERMKAVMVELKENPDVIVFIDEIHTIVGAGNSSGQMDAANILKPALSRNEIQCIGATTHGEYKKYIEKDAALVRRFQKIILEEPSYDETIEILKKLQDSYEDFHKVKYENNVIETIVMLSNRYITDRQFPDKAIDILDELGSEKKISSKIPKSIEVLKGQLDEIKVKKTSIVREQKYELAAQLRDEEKGILNKLEKEKEKWEKSKNSLKISITVDDVYDIVTRMTKIPIARMDDNDSQKMLELENNLKSSVVGQDSAISEITNAIYRSRVGIKDPNKPISYIFLGNTGVGKTLLAKQLAKQLFGSTDNLIRFDMSEFQERHTASRLFGASPGYVGYEEGGELTEKVKNKPYSIILFDEIEKAHKDVFATLLQILDDGRMTDGLGKTINFKNCIIIMTSNIGVKKVQDFGKGIGFGSNNLTNEMKKNTIQKELKRTFAPEFLNRIDDIITFNSLNEENVEKIAEIELNIVAKRINELGYKLVFDNSVIKLIAKVGFDDMYGARPLKRAIQDKIENMVSIEILKGRIVKDTEYHFSSDNDEVTYKIG